ncbi:MAG TPA: hypothetical protein VJN72_00535 [Gaiellales bacterium]|nr:hypothetical protein [Gaiellales bacterium]
MAGPFNQPLSRPTREDTQLVTLRVDDVDFGVFDKKTGGNADSEETKYTPGGMAKEVSLGGRQTHENITLSREFDWGRDGPGVAYLIGRRGRAAVTIGQQFLDIDGNARGNPITATGTLKSVQVPDHDSSGNDAALLELECTIVSLVAT